MQSTVMNVGKLGYLCMRNERLYMNEKKIVQIDINKERMRKGLIVEFRFNCRGLLPVTVIYLNCVCSARK